MQLWQSNLFILAICKYQILAESASPSVRIRRCASRLLSGSQDTDGLVQNCKQPLNSFPQWWNKMRLLQLSGKLFWHGKKNKCFTMNVPWKPCLRDYFKEDISGNMQVCVCVLHERRFERQSFLRSVATQRYTCRHFHYQSFQTKALKQWSSVS